MSNTFPARFGSKCPSCGEWIAEGDTARWSATDEVIHASCEEPELVPDVPAVPCRRCFMVPALNGSCGCDL